MGLVSPPCWVLGLEDGVSQLGTTVGLYEALCTGSESSSPPGTLCYPLVSLFHENLRAPRWILHVLDLWNPYRSSLLCYNRVLLNVPTNRSAVRYDNYAGRTREFHRKFNRNYVILLNLQRRNMGLRC